MSWDSKERRQFVRIKFPCEIFVQESKKHTLSTYAENISAGGLRVILKEKLKTSSIVEIDIYGLNKKPLVCKGKVMWVFSRKCSPDKDILVFDTGIEFYQIKEKDVAEIKKLITSITSGWGNNSPNK